MHMLLDRLKMNLFSVTVLLLFPIVAVAHLEWRQACYEDNCLRAINGTRRDSSHPVTGFKNCADYMTTTILEDPITTTKTETIFFTRNPTASDFITPSATPGLRQAQTKRRPHLEARITTAISTHGSIPYYATSACNDEHYSSACSCIGVVPATITQANYTVTRTVTLATADPTGSCSSIIPTSISATTSAMTLSNSTTSSSTTSSTFIITFSFNSSTTTTVITLSSPSNSTTGTISSSVSSSTTPPWLNSTTTSFTNSWSSTPTYSNTTTPYNATSTISTCTTDTTSLANATTSFNPSTSLSSTSTWANSTTSCNATSITASTTDTTLSTTSEIFPTPTPCSGATFGLCNGTCSDLSTEAQNCGACNNTCTPGHTCTNGVCTRPPCDSTCLTQRGCGPVNSTCICGAESGGAGVCFEGSGLCNDFDNCVSTADCRLGFVCVPENCCGRGKCLNTEGCGSQGSLGTRLGLVRKVIDADLSIGEMNLLGGYLD